MKVADSAKDSAGKLPMWRAEWDAVHAKGDCPYPPHPPRKYQWLPCTNSGPILNAFGLLMWVPLGIVVFCVSLFLNLWTWFIAYTYHGGAHGLAASTTLPLSNRIIRKLFSLVDVCNVTELPKPWDEAKAKQAFDAFRVRNGFAEEEARILVTTIPDTVMKPEVWHKYRMTDLASTAKVHYVHVLTAPSKTFVVGYTNFRDFDGTSCFNLIKGFVATYYDGEAPLVRPTVGSPELDLRLDTENEELKKKLGALPALRCAVGTSYTMAVQYGRWLLSRELFDAFGCASPECCSVIESLSLEETAKMTAALKARKLKPFAHLMTTSAEAAKSVPKKYQVERPILLTQVSCQSRYYMPKVERNVCGNWLIGLGTRPTLDELSSESWASKFYAGLIEHIESFSGNAAWSFINQTVYGMSGYRANPRKIFWFNNYGLRSMHEGAGGVTYHWAPTYSVATYFLVCCVCVDGRMCITISSSVVPQGELQKAVEHMKKMLIESAGGEALSTARVGLKAASFAAKLRHRTERSCAKIRRSSFAAATFGGAAL